MKTKPNFTYKQFIQKISQVALTPNHNIKNKSPTKLKSQNKNIPSSSVFHPNKPSYKNITTKQQSFKKNASSRITPRRSDKKENDFQAAVLNQTRGMNSKNTTNNKLQLKNQLNFPAQSNRKQSLKQSKTTQYQIGGNQSYNRSCFQNERHNESCSTFYKNFNYDNEQDNFHNNSIGTYRNPAITSRLKSKKHSASSIDSKIKMMPKGSITDRNIHRVNTQYEESRCQITDRLNTQYERVSVRDNRESPSFYKQSVDESSFLDFEEDKSNNHLFAESSVSCTKKSTISLISSTKNTKINSISYEHIYNKFITAISEILFRITKTEDQSQLLDYKIKYIEFLECLKELKMIRSDYEPYSQVEGVDLVKEFWEELVMGHNINHFIIIVALILKVTPIEQVKSDNPLEIQNYLFLQKKYQHFRFTRLELDKSKSFSQKQSIEYYNFPFKPTISKASEQLALKPRSQRKFKINTSVNHNQSSQLQSRGQNISISTEFQNHNQSVSSPSVRLISPLGNKRSELLYKEGKKKSLQKKGDKSTIDYEYEKNKDELTFKPKIIIKRKKQQVEENIDNYISPRFALDEQKSINRIIRGRVQKQVKQMTIDKGIPYNEKMIQKLRREKFQEIIKEQHYSRLKKQQNQTLVNLKKSQIQTNIDRNSHNRCTTQVEHLQNILNLSFEDLQKSKDQNPDGKIQNEQCLLKYIQHSPLRTSNFRSEDHSNQKTNIQPEYSPEDYFVLDIYFEQDRSEKLMIKRDSTLQTLISQAEKFVQKHNLPHQMENKLKQQLMIAMKFHDIQKIQENDEDEECSLLG